MVVVVVVGGNMRGFRRLGGDPVERWGRRGGLGRFLLWGEDKTGFEVGREVEERGRLGVCEESEFSEARTWRYGYMHLSIVFVIQYNVTNSMIVSSEGVTSLQRGNFSPILYQRQGFISILGPEKVKIHVCNNGSLPCHQSDGVACQHKTDRTRLGCVFHGVGGAGFVELKTSC